MGLGNADCETDIVRVLNSRCHLGRNDLSALLNSVACAQGCTKRWLHIKVAESLALLYAAQGSSCFLRRVAATFQMLVMDRWNHTAQQNCLGATFELVQR